MPEIADPAGSVASWKVPEVAQWLEAHHFPPAAVESFRTNAVSGADLLQLTDADLEDHLGLTPLLVGAAAVGSMRQLGRRAGGGSLHRIAGGGTGAPVLRECLDEWAPGCTQPPHAARHPS